MIGITTMEFRNRAGEPIRSLDEWRTLGKPASKKHWRPNRSAYELAADWIERDATERVTDLLSARPEFAGIELLTGTAEKQTRFDDIPRGPRNHDLLIEARTDEGSVLIGVEGKADEPFDRALAQWREQALKRSPRSDAPRRLDQLTALFFGTTLDEDTGEPPLGDLGYQLVSALAGTLADAESANAVRAVVLVHEFRTIKTVPEKHAINERALDDFLLRLAGEAPERTELENGWVAAPIEVRGDGTYMPDRLPVSFAKLVTRVPG